MLGWAEGALAACQHVAVEMAPGRNLVDLAGQAFAKAGIPRGVVTSVPTFAAAVAVVAATDFVASVPRSLVDVLGVDVRIVATPLPALTIPMSLAWHQRTHDDAVMTIFRALVRDACQLPRRGARRPSARSRKRQPRR